MKVLLFVVHFLEYTFFAISFLITILVLIVFFGMKNWEKVAFQKMWKRRLISSIPGLKQKLHLDEYCYFFSLVTHDWKMSMLAEDYDRQVCRNCGKGQRRIDIDTNKKWRWVDDD